MNTAATTRTAATQRIAVGSDTCTYRELGPESGVPLVCLPHFTAVIDDWDPRTIDAIAATRRVILFDNRGVGGSTGSVPLSVNAMARDAVAFIYALGLDQVDLLGFSLGGMIAQTIAVENPKLVRRMILAGTGPAGGNDGAARLAATVARGLVRRPKSRLHLRFSLFFPWTPQGERAIDDYVARIRERTEDLVGPVSVTDAIAQLIAIGRYRSGRPHNLSELTQPTLVANGSDDIMVATKYSHDMAERLPNAKLVIYPASGHGGVFQHYEHFVPEVLALLDNRVPA
jgi:pimeloyl-ACP methyl ester carboxylesterase